MIQARRLMGLTMIGFVIVFLTGTLVIALEPSAVDVLFDLLLGFIVFAWRVLPKVHVRWDGIVFFLVFTGIAVATAHSFFGWIYRSNAPESNEAVRKWKLRWTMAIIAMVLLVFGVGLSFAGVVHQVGWISTSPRPIYVSKIQSNEDHLLSGYDPNHIDEGRYRDSWMSAICFFVPIIVEAKDRSVAWNHPTNAMQFKRVYWTGLNSMLSGPIKSPDGFGLAHFAGNPKILEGPKPVPFKQIEAGLSNTYMVGECNAGFVPWGRIGNTRRLDLGLRHDWKNAKPGQLGYGPVNHHPSTMFFMCDGSVREVNMNVDPKVLSAMDRDPAEPSK